MVRRGVRGEVGMGGLIEVRRERRGGEEGDRGCLVRDYGEDDVYI